MAKISLKCGVTLLCGVLAGCASDPRTGPVTGKVTFGEVPVTAGIVSIIAGDQSGMASGDLSADGTYTIADAPVGDVRITVKTSDSAYVPGPGKVMAKDEPKSSADVKMTFPKNPRYVATPPKYENSETSGLQTRLPKPGSTPFVYNIELKK